MRLRSAIQEKVTGASLPRSRQRSAGPSPDRRPGCRTTQDTLWSCRTSCHAELSTESPATASIQLDYVFASRGFHERVDVRAMNAAAEWGASDHCRLLIEIAGQ